MQLESIAHKRVKELLERHQAKDAERVAGQQQLYDQMLRRAASDPKISDRDFDKLIEIAESLKISFEQVVTDISLLQEAAAYEAAAAKFDELAVAAKAAAKALQRHDEETIAIIEARKLKRRAVEADMYRARHELGKAGQAKNALEGLHRKHWKLFKKEDPAIASRRIHLVHTGSGEALPVGQHRVVQLATLLSGKNVVTGHEDGPVFTPLPDQEKAEFEMLVAIAKAAPTFHAPAAFLSNRGTGLPAVEYSGIDAWTVEALAEVDFDPRARTWVIRPGQTPEQLLRAVEALIDCREKWLKAHEYEPRNYKIATEIDGVVTVQ